MPRIGIVANELLQSEIMYGAEMAYLAMDFVHGVTEAGGTPLAIPLSDVNKAKEYIDMIDGLLLAGGQDVSPFFYGEEPHTKLGMCHPGRDEMEIALVKEALIQKKPIFAICRGLQIVNVALGGTLYQDIETQANAKLKHAQETMPYFETHSIVTEDESKVNKLLGKSALVNSLHHQAVKDVANELIATAYSQDGIIEAIESKNKEQYILAVQWHPEILLRKKHEGSQILFKDFVDACGKNEL